MKQHNYSSLTSPTPEDLFSPMEFYHENSKFHVSDAELSARISVVNSSPEIHRLISRPFVNYPGHPVVGLPKEFPQSQLPFEPILLKRRSEHNFSQKPVELAALAKVMLLADGIVSERVSNEGNVFSLRTAPSAGGLYPIDLYCFALRVADLPAGLYYYNPLQPQLERLREGDFSDALAQGTSLRQEAHAAAACIALVGVLPRSSFKYGQRAYRFLLLEAGHIGQNILLAAEALGLGAVPVGGFYDNDVNKLLPVDGCDDFAIYLIFVGGKADHTNNHTGIGSPDRKAAELPASNK
jgi:SagB-type dehydrogenase family enzyme